MGIIPRISRDIFDHIYSMDENLEFHIKVMMSLNLLVHIHDIKLNSVTLKSSEVQIPQSIRESKYL